jgi:hypothetical protein
VADADDKSKNTDELVFELGAVVLDTLIPDGIILPVDLTAVLDQAQAECEGLADQLYDWLCTALEAWATEAFKDDPVRLDQVFAQLAKRDGRKEPPEAG